ncbi:MAG: bifunctional folylpolyglutamate synthase/dihydrofolate synthase [Clostridia bacterium]|nr:bifunctional folylpolyglutamate synthase/dihydrofolate synthase [Clostridia bacterium]
MNSTEAIEYIHSRLKFGINPGMERITALCTALGNPQDSLRFVHVAGTNGKGSTSTMIASALTATGYKTGLFTSPYVIDFRERIQVDGEMISPDDLAKTVEQVKCACEEIEKDGIVPTEFETITAAAFVYFKNIACDVVVLEVGLGGLLDSTNIIKTPLVSVITSISTDHTAVLGDTIEEIAAQKSGIIKPDGITVMYPEQEPEAEKVIRNAAEKNNNRFVVPQLSDCDINAETLNGTDVVFGKLNLHIPFAGAHMVKNAVTAVCALRKCGLTISDEQIAQGIASAVMPARMEVIGNGKVILDGGHNEGCAEALKAFAEKFVTGKRIAVCALMGDKDCETYLRIVAPLFDKMYVTAPDNPRSLPPQELCELAQKYCENCVAVASPVEACKEALSYAQSMGGTTVVCGSFYLAGEVREFLLENF